MKKRIWTILTIAMSISSTGFAARHAAVEQGAVCAGHGGVGGPRHVNQMHRAHLKRLKGVVGAGVGQG